MELKNYKYIKNTKKLPGFDDGFNLLISYAAPITGMVNTEYLNNPIVRLPGFFDIKPGALQEWYLPKQQRLQVALTEVPTNFRTPITQNIAPVIDTASKVLSPGIVDVTPQGDTIRERKTPTNKVTSTNIADVATSTIGAIFDIYSAHQYDKTPKDLLNEVGQSQDSVGGIGYTRQNSPDRYGEMKRVNKEGNANTFKSALASAGAGAAIGSIVPGLGTVAGGLIGGAIGAIGGLFGSSRRKRAARRALEAAERKQVRDNEFARSEALTAKLQQDEAMDMAGYAEGKDVYTSDGKMPMQPNARVAGDESIVNLANETGTVVKDGYRGVDGPVANLRPDDIVFGKQKDWRNGLTFMDQAMPYTSALEDINKKYNRKMLGGVVGKLTQQLQLQELNKIKEPIMQKLQDLAQLQKYQHDIEGYVNTANAKYGKDCLPGFKLGGYMIPGIFGALASAYQYFDAAHQNIKSPNTYFDNPYKNRALQTLAGLRVNEYPIIRQMRDAEARAAKAIDLSGATPAHKYLARVAAAANTQTAIGDMMPKIQEQKNALKAQYANTLASVGQADRAARADAARWDLDYYSKAHAARQNGMQTGLYNFLNNLNQTYANAFKYNTYNKMYNLYNTELTKEQRDALINMTL